jgi:hypothetical protein
MQSLDIERFVRRGAASLAESLHFYWPSTGRNEIPERNISLHVAHAFIDASFLCYGEAHTNDKTNLHVDLLAVHPAAGVFVAGEFKRLYDGAQARAMVEDAARLQQFKMQQRSQLRHPGLQIARQFGLLAATTWDEKYARWFTTTAGKALDPTGGAFDQLLKMLPQKDTIWNAHTLINYHDADADRDRTQWLVYALFPLA